MWIGVLSDTYGQLDPKVLDIFDGVDYILHCGNIGGVGVLEELSHLAPVTGVLGNVDDAADYEGSLEKSLLRTWFETDVLVVHRLGEPLDLAPLPRRLIDDHDPQVVLFGHPQEPYNTRVDNRLFFNPGRAGRRRQQHPPSVGLLEIEGRISRAEIIPLVDEGS